MDKTAVFIGDSVDLVSANYYKLMLKTKYDFFIYLKEGKTLGQFENRLDAIWGKVDHTFMKQRLEELSKIVSKENIQDNPIKNKDTKLEDIYKINPISFYETKEAKFMNDISKYYDDRYTTLQTGIDQESYLTSMVDKYDGYQQNIPYYTTSGAIHSYHNISDYLSMCFNSDLTRSAWNTTNYDADLLGQDLLYLPAHPHACPLCIDSQGKVYSKSGKSKKYPPQSQAIQKGVGHPNCKHVWTIYWDESQIQKDKFNDEEWQEKYKEQQKQKAIKRESLKYYNDAKIYKELGNYEAYEKARLKYKGLRAKLND